MATASSSDGDKKTLLVSAVRKLAAGLARKVEDVRKKYNPSEMDWFLNSDSRSDGVMGIYPVGLYLDCLESVGVKTRAQLEEVWKELYKAEEVRECVEELLSAEENFDNFVEEVDKDLQSYEDSLAVSQVSTVGCSVPKDISLVEAKSGNAVILGNLLKQSKFTVFVLRKHYI